MAFVNIIELKKIDKAFYLYQNFLEHYVYFQKEK